MTAPLVVVIPWSILRSTKAYFKEPLYGYQSFDLGVFHFPDSPVAIPQKNTL
jgi:hypothetical protein